MIAFENLLKGSDLRSLGKSKSLLNNVKDQESFDELFQLLFHPDEVIAMRAADVCEKIIRTDPSYLQKHKKEVLELARGSSRIEILWHVALMLPKLSLNTRELSEVWKLLTHWAEDDQGSKIVRVNSLQGLFELTVANKFPEGDLLHLFHKLELKQIPSISARIRKLRRNLVTV